MTERISLADVKRDIADAFNGLFAFEAEHGEDVSVSAARAANIRVDAFLAQVEAERKQLHLALLACRDARHALAGLNGDVSREVWERLYPVTQTLNRALIQSGPTGDQP